MGGNQLKSKQRCLYLNKFVKIRICRTVSDEEPHVLVLNLRRFGAPSLHDGDVVSILHFSRGEQMDTTLKQGEETNIFVKIVSEIMKKKYQIRDYTRLLKSFLSHSIGLQSSTACTQPKKRSFTMCNSLVIVHRPQSTTLIKVFSSQGAKLPHLTSPTYNTIQLYCLYVEKFAFWLIIYIKTFNTVNNKTSTTQ